MTEILSLAVVAALIMHSTQPAVSTPKAHVTRAKISDARSPERAAHSARARAHLAKSRRTASHSRGENVVD